MGSQGDSTETGRGEAWLGVDEGWGRRAVDFATLSEPSNVREYVAMHQHLGVGPGVRLLDVACGSGLAVELAGARGATCAGIDASPRLVAVARDRSPLADLRVGDMHDLPWEDDSFDVVTSFRGIWATTPDAVREIHRVLVPGGRVGIAVWGHIKASPGAWGLSPFSLAEPPKVDNQRAMVALGRPGAGEALLAAHGFEHIERVDIPFVMEYSDPEAYARGLASTGPGYEAILAVGEEAFLRSAMDTASDHVREGLPLRAPIQVVGYLARKPMAVEDAPAAGFLAPAAASAEAQAMYDGDEADMGFVMNTSRVWAHDPAIHDAIGDLIGHAARAGSLTYRQRGILIAALASAMGDSYCSLAWGKRLAGEAGDEAAAGVLRGDDEALDPAERVLARWARQVSRDPNATTPADIEALRGVGFDDAQIFAITCFIGLRVAFSTVNDALGARPDHELHASAPAPVRDAVDFGRPVAPAPGGPT